MLVNQVLTLRHDQMDRRLATRIKIVFVEMSIVAYRPFPICSMYGIFTYIIREPLAHQKKRVP